MPTRNHGRLGGKGLCALVCGATLWVPGAWADESEIPPLPLPDATPATVATTDADVKPPPGTAPAEESSGASREAELEERLRQLEAMHQRLLEQYEAMDRKHSERFEALSRQYQALSEQLRAVGGDGASGREPFVGDGDGASLVTGASGTPRDPSAADRDAAVPGYHVAPPRPTVTDGDWASLFAGDARPRRDLPATERDPAVPGYHVAPPRTAPERIPVHGHFWPGFELMSEDEEYQLQFHNETQIEVRLFEQQNQEPVSSGFFIPRQRWFFNGRVTRPIEYMTSINRGFRDLDLLDAFLNFNYDERAQVRIGRFMTPMNYEQFAIQNMNLIAPERSLFTTNFGLNRLIGAMGWGYVFDKRLDYALGIFNSGRNALEPFNDEQDLMVFLNARPFQENEDLPWLRYLNLGGAFTGGFQTNPLVPTALRTATNASNARQAQIAAPPFLVWNDNVREDGNRRFWSGHLAYYYQGLSLLAAYDGGQTDYIRISDLTGRVTVPVSAYYVQFGYFLTGEAPERRSLVEPLRPFDLRPGRRGPGALEVHARYSVLEVGDTVFTAGLADPNLWSNRAYAIDTGFNWYLNRYIKIYFDWQHAEFGAPVLYRPTARQLTSDLFWLRFQLYF